MIFPSSGQTVHSVLLSFPEKAGEKKNEKSGGVKIVEKKVPKLIRTDSEKCIPVSEVENTKEGAKLKFVHNGIRMVMYDDTKVSQQQIRDSTRKLQKPNAPHSTVKPQPAAPKIAPKAPSLHHPPQMHIHTSDEMMPDFLGKMTVGLYSPEKTSHHFQRSLINDSYISTVNNTQSHVVDSSHSHTDNSDADVLMLDKYLNIHSYSPVNEPVVVAPTSDVPQSARTGASRGSSRGKLGAHHSSGHDISSTHKDSLVSPKKESPKRVEVPLLFGLSPTNIALQQSPDAVKDILPGGPVDELKHGLKVHGEEERAVVNKLVFDDSAPSTAAATQKRPGLSLEAVATVAPLEPIEDTPSPAIISRAVSNLTDAFIGDFEQSDKGNAHSDGNTPQHLLRTLDPSVSEYGFESISHKLDSPSSMKSYELSGQYDLQKLQYKVVNAAVPTHTPQVLKDLHTEWDEEIVGIAAGASKTPISAVVVKVEGTTVSPTDAFLFEGSMEDSARSFGLDSLSALSDSMSNINDGVAGRNRSNSQATRATILRDQSTKALLTRMDSGSNKQKGPVYTSKSSVGADGSVSSETREKVKKKLVAAARLIVAFKPAPKGKVVVNKDSGLKETVSFAIKSSPAVAATAASPAPQADKGDDESDDIAGEMGPADRALLGNRGRSLSIMTDSVDDSPCATVNPSPAGMPHVAAVNTQPPIFSGRRTSETPRKVAIEPIMASKQNLFDFKPPEEVANKQLLSKKSVGSFISKLKERVGREKAGLVEQLVEAADDDDSVVTSYFDHSAAPIFVEREKVEKHVLHSKRFDKAPEGKEYKPKYGDDDSSVEEGTAYEGLTRSRGYSAAGGREMYDVPDAALSGDAMRDGARVLSGGAAGGPGLATVVKVIVKPQFDLSKFLNSVSDDEREALEELPQESVNEIMELMNVALAGKGKATVNKKNLTYFRNLIARLKQQKVELERLNMDLQLELLDTTDRVISVSASSVHGGAAIILLTVDTPTHVNRPYTIMTVGAVEALGGLVAYECREIEPNSLVDVTFANLRPETNYVVYVIADSTHAKLVPLTDEDKAPVQLLINTQQEILEIEWSRLSTEMQLTEIRAALRTNWLRDAAAALYPPMPLPVDDDVHLEDFAPHTEAEDPKKPGVKDHMSPKTHKKGAANKGGRLTEAEEQHKNTWRAFLDWWVGQSPMLVTKIRAEFQLKEALFAVQQELVNKKYLESGLTTKAEVDMLVKYCVNMEAALAAGKVKKETFPVSPEFRKFRSWFKGGQVVRDSVEASLAEKSEDMLKKSIDSFTSVVTERNALVNTALSMQLAVRTQLLQARIVDVEACKDIVKELVAGHYYAQEHSLVEDDLLFKRSQLSPQDLISIMSSKRLVQLCTDCGLITAQKALSGIPIDAFGQAGKFNYMKIAGADLFKILNQRILRPDDPPPIVMETLPGTSRKPLKAWQLCSHDEKMMEVAVACSLDIILYHALKDRVAVPNVEDVVLKHGVFATRDAKFAKFVSWYAGEEEIDRIPGHAPPTLQRTVFAETWETDCVKSDPYVVESLVDNQYPVPEQYFLTSSRLRGSMMSIKVPSGDSFFAPLLELYRDTVGKLSGNFLRLGLLARHLTTIIGCRRATVLRWMWPPGAARTGRQFLFPKMGLITPPFDLPPRRIKPFPSRRPDAYTHLEMIAWYSAATLDEDDELMQAGEVEGVRLRSYHNWLAQEKERQEHSRKQMLQEDFEGHMRREINKEVEYRLKLNANKLKYVVEHARDDDPDKEIELKFAASLPSEYWYIFEESQEYKYGSGIHNEDELEEYREAERQRARNAEIEAEKFENYLQEEIFRREQEELAKQKREEQDRRLAEGVARRRRLREHLEDLKRQRAGRADEAERQRLEAEKRRQEELAAAEYQRQRDRVKQQEIARCQQETQLMYAEDVLVTDNRARNREVKRMEHEDIRSFMREQHEAREKVQLRERFQALEELYQTFNPFPAKLASEHMHTLQGLLQHDQSVAKIYQDVMDTLSQSSSHRSRVAEHTTDSVNRKRSVRYKRIFEGSPGDASYHDDDSPRKSLHSHEEVVDPVEQSKHALEKLLPQHDPKHPQVRSLYHSPTKHSIRKNGALLPNPYDAQWKMLQHNSSQCFVRTSAETFPTPSESLPTLRTMTALGPIIPALQANTSLFETGDDNHYRDARPPLPLKQAVPKKTFESDILQKFGASASAAPKSPTFTDSFFDDSAQLDTTTSKSSLVPFSAGTISARQPPAPQRSANVSEKSYSQYQFTNTDNSNQVDLYSQTLPRDTKHISYTGEGSMSSGQPVDFTASFDSSLFRSLSPLDEDKAKNGKEHKGARKKMKDLLSTSADMLAKSNEQEWLAYLQTQRKATFASLSTLDAKTDAAKRRIEKLTMTVEPPKPTATGEGTTANARPASSQESREKKMQVAQLKKELKELGIVDESILDFKTRQLAKAASESVIRMKAERAMLRQYVGSGAVLRDEFYLMAVEPGDRHVTSLEVSDEVKKFAENVTRHIDGEELMFPSITSTEAIAPAAATRVPKVKTPAAMRATPKAHLKFGKLEPTDLFMEMSEDVEPKEADVKLDLGVTSFSRNNSAQIISAPVPRARKPMTKAKAASECLLPNLPSLVGSISTISASQSGLLPSTGIGSNPLGIVRGNPVPVAKEAPVMKHRKAFYDTSRSSSSALPLAMSLTESTHGELTKKDSTLSRSVELYINTPTASKKSRRKGNAVTGDADEESVASSAGFSISDQRYPDLQPFEPEYGLNGGESIASVGSASIVLD